MTRTSDPLLIPAAIRDAMVEHCRSEAPREACGLLTGLGREARTFVPLGNAKASETRYEADSRDLIDAVVAMRHRGEAIVAIYHSHPRWAAVPSRTDLEQNYYGDVPRIIVSLLAEPPDIRAWRLDAESYEELEWAVMPPGVESGATPP